tara:strand:+ start:3443 stop:3811 length:369 start_codon:yes stop_codon:yes gene_type:complete
MSFDGKNPFRVLRQTWNPGGYEKETLTGNKTLTHSDAQVIGLNCGTGGGRDVILPAPRKGAWFWIFNQSTDADNLAVKQADGTTALATINQNESGLFFCDADAADDSASGWDLMGLITIAMG